jgi:carboxylesterase
MQRPVLFQHPQLNGSSFYWHKGEVAILCLHGFTATTVEVRKIALTFQENGYTTCGPLFPGHGTSPEDLNNKTWMDWVETAEASFLFLREKYKHVFILGESMGGLVALHLGAKYQDIPGLMVCAPALTISNLALSRFLSFFREYIYKKNTDDSMPWQGYNVVPLKAASSLYEFQKIVKNELEQVISPIIIFQGKKDTTIDPTSSIIVYESISSHQKDLVWLPRSGHVILLDGQLTEVETMCLEFIQHVLVPTDDL